MTCKNCGSKILENEIICPKCGSAAYSEDLNISATGTERIVPRGFSAKKNIIILIIAALLALGVGGTAVALGIYNIPANRVSRYMGAAERYLSEQNYEQAIIEFQRILEIEPMNVDAYLGLADAYIGLGQTDKAIETLEEGFDKTGDQRIKDKLDELTPKPESSALDSLTNSSNPTVSEPTEPAYGSMGSVTIAGTELDIATTVRLLIINMELYSNGNWSSNLIDDNPEEYYDDVIYLTENLVKDDFEKLSQLVHLSCLDIHYAGITDLSPLANLANLTDLNLWNNQISDITSLANLTNLTQLNLVNNQISDITPLANLTNLMSLDFWDNQISDITPLANLTNLTALGLSGNQISDTSPLANLTNLTQLELEDNQISDITPLANLTHLELLYLFNNQISDITPLANLTNLTYLGLNENQISDISSLANLTNLTSLQLGENQIVDITPLTKLTNLTYLSLFYNQISDITPLANLTNLTDLQLQGNQLSDIMPLAKLTNLRYLSLWNNQISDKDKEWLKTQLPNCDIS